MCYFGVVVGTWIWYGRWRFRIRLVNFILEIAFPEFFYMPSTYLCLFFYSFCLPMHVCSLRDFSVSVCFSSSGSLQELLSSSAWSTSRSIKIKDEFPLSSWKLSDLEFLKAFSTLLLLSLPKLLLAVSTPLFSSLLLYSQPSISFPANFSLPFLSSY